MIPEIPDGMKQCNYCKLICSEKKQMDCLFNKSKYFEPYAFIQSYALAAYEQGKKDLSDELISELSTIMLQCKQVIDLAEKIGLESQAMVTESTHDAYQFVINLLIKKQAQTKSK